MGEKTPKKTREQSEKHNQNQCDSKENKEKKN